MGLGLVSIFPFSRVSCRNKMFAAASLMLKLLMTTWRNHCQNCQQALAVLLAGENIPAVVYCSVPSAVLYGTALQCTTWLAFAPSSCTFAQTKKWALLQASVTRFNHKMLRRKQAQLCMLLVLASLCGHQLLPCHRQRTCPPAQALNRCVLCLQIQPPSIGRVYRRDTLSDLSCEILHTLPFSK